jgi:hypothetical protein
MMVKRESSGKEDMSLEGLGCLESLVPSKPSEPTLTSNRLLILPYPTLKIGIGYWQHWILATFPTAHKSTNMYCVNRESEKTLF